MATKTSGEIEKEFFQKLQTETGEDLGQWISKIKNSGKERRNDIIALLKSEFGFGHMNASLLAGIYANGGRPVYGNTSELLDNQFAKAAEMRPLYESFVAFVNGQFPAALVLPKKTYISIVGKREFAAINIRKDALRVGFDLGEFPFDELVTKSKLTGPMPRISHMITLTADCAFSDAIVNLLHASYNRSH